MVFLNPVTGEKCFQVFPETVLKLHLKDSSNGSLRVVEDEEEIRCWLNGIYDRICKGRIHWSNNIDDGSKTIISALLHREPSERLGNTAAGAQDVMRHPWFVGTDWLALERRELTVGAFRFVVMIFPLSFL